MSTNQPPDRDQQQVAFMAHARQRINAIIPEEFDELRESAFDYAVNMMIGVQLPSTPSTLCGNADQQSGAFLVPFREEGQLALGMAVLEDINRTLAQYGVFKESEGPSR